MEKPVVKSDAQQSDLRTPKPTGVWFLGWLHVISGIAIVAVMVLGAFRLIDAKPHSFAVHANTALLAALNLAAGIGLLRGAKWGWSVAVLYQALAVYRALAAIAFAYHSLPALGASSAEVRGVIDKYLLRAAVAGMLTAYLLTEAVRRQFRIHLLRKRTLLAALIPPILGYAVIEVLVTRLTK